MHRPDPCAAIFCNSWRWPHDDPVPTDRHDDGDDRLSIRYASTVVEVRGEIDLLTASEFRRALTICDSDPVVRALDLSRVSFFSAAGVRCFVEADWPGRPHVPVIASCSVRRVLDLCELGFLLEPHGWRCAFDGWTGASSGGV
jgi:anti-anti-sigma factor